MKLSELIKKWEIQSKGRIWLIPGLFCALFSGGAWSSAFLTWFYIIFLWKVAIYTKKNNLLNYVLIAIVLWIAAVFKYNGVIVGEGLLFHVFFVLILPAIFIWPFVFGGILYRKFSNSLVKIILFPAIWTLFDWLAAFSGIGAAISIAGTQYEFYTIMQLASLTGLYGITFFMTIVGTYFVELWNNGFHIKGNKHLARTTFCIVILVIGVLLYGSFRLVMNDTTGEKMRVASVLNFYSVKNTEDPNAYKQMKSDDNFKREIEGMTYDVQNAKKGNAEIVMWQEDCFALKEKNVDKLLEHAQNLARENNIAIILPLDISRENNLSLNELAVINNDGSLEQIYQKVNLVPVVETSTYVKGTNPIPCVNINGTNISSCICFDAINPVFVHSTMDKSTDILLVPAWEWESIASFAGTGSIIRSIENGVSYIRNTSMGITFAVDQYGRPSNWHTTLDTNQEIIFSDVPNQHVFTLYKYAGDWLVYLCIGYIAATIIYLIISKRKKKNVK